MNRYILRTLCVALLLITLPSLAHAVKPRKSGKVYEGPTSVPAEFKSVTYVTGIPEIDVKKYTQYSQAQGRLELNTSEAIYYKKRIDQKRGKGLESVELFKIPYSEIKELYFGYDAIFKAANDSLPTALNTIYDRGGWPLFSARALPLHMYMKKRQQSPIIVYYNRGKTLTSVVLMTRTGPAKSIYQLLAEQAGLKVKEPKTIDGMSEDN